MSIEALACVGLAGLVVGFLVGLLFGVALAGIKNTEIVRSIIDEEERQSVIRSVNERGWK